MDTAIRRYAINGWDTSSHQEWSTIVLAYSAEDALAQARLSCSLMTDGHGKPCCTVMGVAPAPAEAKRRTS